MRFTDSPHFEIPLRCVQGSCFCLLPALTRSDAQIPSQGVLSLASGDASTASFLGSCLPGAPSPQHCVLTGDASCAAGSPARVRVALADAFGNPCAASASLHLAFSVVASSSSSSGDGGRDNATASVAVLARGAGFAEAAVTPGRSGEYQVVAKLLSTGGGGGGAADAQQQQLGSPLVLRAAPRLVDARSCAVSLPPGGAALTAGKPFSFTLTARDRLLRVSDDPAVPFSLVARSGGEGTGDTGEVVGTGRVLCVDAAVGQWRAEVTVERAGPLHLLLGVGAAGAAGASPNDCLVIGGACAAAQPARDACEVLSADSTAAAGGHASLTVAIRDAFGNAVTAASAAAALTASLASQPQGVENNAASLSVTDGEAPGTAVVRFKAERSGEYSVKVALAGGAAGGSGGADAAIGGAWAVRVLPRKARACGLCVSLVIALVALSCFVLLSFTAQNRLPAPPCPNHPISALTPPHPPPYPLYTRRPTRPAASSSSRPPASAALPGPKPPSSAQCATQAGGPWTTRRRRSRRVGEVFVCELRMFF